MWSFTCDAPRSRHPIEAATPEIIDKSTILFWLIDEWKCASLLRPQVYHMTQWFEFCTNNWVWKNYRQDGCRVCYCELYGSISTTMWWFQNNVWRCFNVIQMNFCIDSLLWWNMDPLFHTRDEGTVKTMDFNNEWTSSEEDRKVDRKGDGHSFLGCTLYNSYRLSSVEANDQWRLLRSFIGPFQQHFKEKTSPFGEEVLFQIMHGFTRTRHRWPNSTNSTTNCFSI